MNVNTNRMVELALVFFVSLLSFSIGTFVGKKYSDNQHRLAKLEPNGEKAHEMAKEMHEATEATEPKIVEHKQETLTDTEVAQMAKEFSDEEDAKDINEVEESSHAATGTTAAALKKLTAMKKVRAVEEKEVKEIVDHKDVVREVASIANKVKKATQPENFNYTVQVAAYPSAEEADKMVATLGARGYNGRSVSADVNGRKWYRVQIGNFENFKDADTYKKEIMEQNRLTSALVQKVAKTSPAPASESPAHPVEVVPAGHGSAESHAAPAPAPAAAPEHTGGH